MSSTHRHYKHEKNGQYKNENPRQAPTATTKHPDTQCQSPRRSNDNHQNIVFVILQTRKTQLSVWVSDTQTLCPPNAQTYEQKPSVKSPDTWVSRAQTLECQEPRHLNDNHQDTVFANLQTPYLQTSRHRICKPLLTLTPIHLCWLNLANCQTLNLANYKYSI